MNVINLRKINQIQISIKQTSLQLSSGRGRIFRGGHQNYSYFNGGRWCSYGNKNNCNHRLSYSPHRYDNHRRSYNKRNYRPSPRRHSNNYRANNYGRHNYESDDSDDSFMDEPRRQFHTLCPRSNESRSRTRSIHSESNNVSSYITQQRQQLSWNTNHRNKNKTKNNNNTKPIHPYLQRSQILKWFKFNATQPIDINYDPSGAAFVLKATLLHDALARNNYEYDLWKAYLKMGKENRYWSEEVLQNTKTHDYHTNIRFIQSKLNQLAYNIIELDDDIEDATDKLKNNWAQDSFHQLCETIREHFRIDIPGVTKEEKNPIDRLEDDVMKYIKHCTQYTRDIVESKIQLSKAEMERFKIL
ncbi:unnamed protein product [Rotaria sordida]|uniref:Uncharacterized protein n=1 Tax=Rotaria sordida TaxID=392033 RepID=A0A819T6X0_9BILA|nr:unnamed protein product [Rotaria sordida]CAF1461116.1 unnamed protein product [Rotaria sordida]CAF1501835.1 unnamed protein product [Rotaria sordida]CAF4083147.1 unnamed protein product [Rotaria sordida]CAF4084156.1 unnamed protein product [Rotaria sordida]